MKSLDNLLVGSAPQLSPKSGFSQKVVGRLAWNKIRGRLSTIVGFGVIAMIGLMLRAHGGQMIAYAASKYKIVMEHPFLFVRAVSESIPWPLLTGIIITIGIMLSVRRAYTFLATARVTGTLTTGIFLLISSSAAFASTAPTSELGPAQQQLRMIVNGIGQPTVTVDGVTYNFPTNANLSDQQVRAFAEFQRTVSASGGSGVNQIQVITIEADNVTFRYAGGSVMSSKPQIARITANSVVMAGGYKSKIESIKPGDLALLSQNMSGDIILIGRLTYPISEYRPIGFGVSPTAHRQDGLCYANTADKCPNIAAAYTMYDVSDAYSNDSLREINRVGNKQRIEIYGAITDITPTDIKLTNPSGTVWSLNIGSVIIDANELKLNISSGDYLRIEAWATPAEIEAHALHDNRLANQNTSFVSSDFNASDSSAFSMIQLALNKPWHYGQIPNKL